MNILICTDGSAVSRGKNKGLGGIGAYLDFGDRKIYLSKGFKGTKTGRMELTALWFALSAIPQDVCTIHKVTADLYSDSEYLVKSFTENRIANWVRNGWTNTSGSVANIDLWKLIVHSLRLRPNLSISFNHIKGHKLDKKMSTEELSRLLKHTPTRGNWIADKLADYRIHSTYEEDIVRPFDEELILGLKY